MGLAVEQKKVIGLSFSACVLSIARGEVKIDDVEKIIAGTKIKDDALDESIQIHKKEYWKEMPDECEKIVRELWSQGKIYQPRLEGKMPADRLAYGSGITTWIPSGTEVVYQILGPAQ